MSGRGHHALCVCGFCAPHLRERAAPSAEKPRRLQCKAIVGKVVVLVRDVMTRGGEMHRAGWRYLVSTTWRGRFAMTRVDRRGRYVRQKLPGGHRLFHVRGVERSAFTLDLDGEE